MYRMNQHPPMEAHPDERFGPISPFAAGLLGAGLGYFGGQIISGPGPGVYGPPPGYAPGPYGPGPGYGHGPGYGPGGPGFGSGYGPPGYPLTGPGFGYSGVW